MTEVEEAIRNSQLLLLSVSKPGCKICETLRPRIESMLKAYPRIRSVFVDLNKTSAVRELLAIEYIPTVLLYTSGRETHRETRNVDAENIHEKIHRYYGILFG